MESRTEDVYLRFGPGLPSAFIETPIVALPDRYLCPSLPLLFQRGVGGPYALAFKHAEPPLSNEFWGRNGSVR